MQPVRNVHEVQFASEPEALAYSKVHRDESPTSSDTSSDEEAVVSVDARRRKRETAKFRANVVRLHNRYRKVHGLERLHRNRELDASAAKWAEALLAQPSLSNSNHLYKNLRVGENIASRRSNAPCDYTGTCSLLFSSLLAPVPSRPRAPLEPLTYSTVQYFFCRLVCSRRGGRTLVPRAEQVPVWRRTTRRSGHRCVTPATLLSAASFAFIQHYFHRSIATIWYICSCARRELHADVVARQPGDRCRQSGQTGPSNWRHARRSRVPLLPGCVSNQLQSTNYRLSW